MKLSSFLNKSPSRRSFLAGAGSAAGLALAGCGSDGSMPPVTTSPTIIGDPDILNFALNLEYLEAEFYLHAATGSGLASADIGSNPGTVTGRSEGHGPLFSTTEHPQRDRLRRAGARPLPSLCALRGRRNSCRASGNRSHELLQLPCKRCENCRYLQSVRQLR